MTTVEAGLLPSVSEAIAGFRDELLTPRLRLRPASVLDAAEMFPLFDDWEIVRWLARPIWPQEFAVFRDSLRITELERASGEALYLTTLFGEEIVGGVACTVSEGRAVLGYWVGQRYWSRGFVSEAAGALCDWVFAATAETAIYSGVFEGNAASMRVQHKLGFVQAGVSMQFSVPFGRDLRHLDTKLTRPARRVAREKAIR